MSCAAAVVAADGNRLLLLLLRRRLSASSVHLSNSWPLLTRYQSSAAAAAAAAAAFSSFLPLDAAKLINCNCKEKRKLISTRRRVRRRHIPWLIVSSPSKPESRYLYDIIQQSITREIHLPHIADHRFIGSSQGFLFSLNSRAEIHATNPLTGAHLPLPPTSSLPNVAGVVFDNDKKISGYVVCVNKWSNPPQFDHWDAETKMQYKYYSKAIFSPSLDTAVVIHGDSGRLAFCRPTSSSSSSSSSSWIALHAPIDCFHDIVFHKDRLHAINVDGTVAIFDDDHLNCNDPARRPPTLSPRQRVVEINGHHYRMSLVESPNGEELFLVCREIIIIIDDGAKTMRTNSLTVLKLNQNNYKWHRVESIGVLALFVGDNHSFALSAPPFFPYPEGRLQSNSIYFTDHHFNCCTPPGERVGDISTTAGVYNLNNGTIDFYSLSFDFDGCHHFNWPPPIWHMPTSSCF